MALLHRKMEVINLAICWNSSTLLGTFYSKNLSSNSCNIFDCEEGATTTTQSAGNRSKSIRNKSSSENTRETTYFKFSSFRTLYEKLNYTNQISDSWLVWFIGFVEGDGSIVTFGGRPRFVITQKEKAILDHIHSILGFGTVKKFQSCGASTVFYRYIVQDLMGILLLCILFNGNLCLLHRISQLSR